MRLIVWDYTHYQVHGGKEVFVDTFIREFLNQGNEVLFVSGQDAASNFCMLEESPGLQRLQLPESSILNSPELFSILRRTKTLVREFEPQILFSQSFNCISRILIDSLLTSERNQIAQVLYIHNIKEVEKLRSSTPDSMSIQNIQSFICPSAYISTRLDGTKAETRIEIIPHGVDSKISRSQIKDPKILFVGRLVIEKGLLNLLSAWSMVYKNLPHYELHIYGDGPLNSVTKRLIRESNLSERTINHGEVSNYEIREALSSAEFLVLPSLIPEAFGLSVLEAMNAGLPCLVTNKGALPELVRDGIDGMVVSANNSAEIAEAIRQLATDANIRRRLGNSAKQRAQESFSISKTMSLYQGHFESLL